MLRANVGLSPVSGGANTPGDNAETKPDSPKALSSPVGDAEISSEYGANRENCPVCSPTHAGTDYKVPIGTNVQATASGTVVRAGFSISYGNVVIVDHGAGRNENGNVYTLYAHGSSILVSVGEHVSIGQVIMTSGDTGRNVDGPHLHYEVIQTTFGLGSEFYKDMYAHPAGDLANLLR